MDGDCQKSYEVSSLHHDFVNHNTTFLCNPPQNQLYISCVIFNISEELNFDN